MRDILAVRAKLRQFGFTPKCWHGDAERWLMLYENRMGRSSKRHFLAVYAGTTELYRHPYPTDLAARKDFEQRITGA